MSSSAQALVPGIISGLSPMATVDFLTRIIRETNADSDQQHIRVMVDHNPSVPNRVAAISGTGESAGPHLATMARNLESNGADFLVMVCNSAHAFQEDIERATSIPFVSMVDEVMNVLADRFSSRHRVGVMAARGCMDASLYQAALESVGFSAVIWNETEIDTFMQQLERIKSGDVSPDVVEQVRLLAQSLVDKGAQVLVAGFSEIPLVLSSDMLRVPIISSTAILADSVIDYALGLRDPLSRQQPSKALAED